MDNSKSLSQFFKALAHPTRLQIMKLLESGPLCVCEIFPQVDSEQSNTSQHLSLMKQSGLLSSHREGTKVIYRAADPTVYQIMALSESVILPRVIDVEENMNEKGHL